MPNIYLIHFWVTLAELFQKHQELEIARQRINSFISWMFHAFKGQVMPVVLSSPVVNFPKIITCFFPSGCDMETYGDSCCQEITLAPSMEAWSLYLPAPSPTHLNNPVKMDEIVLLKAKRME
jgi:hypothetical protein